MCDKIDREVKTALITGANSGIGLEYAKTMAARKYNLVIASNQKEIYKVAEYISSEYKVKTYTKYLDLATNNGAYELFKFCQEKNIFIDVLISNAGLLLFDEIDRLRNEQLETIIKLHVQTPTILCKLFGTEMKKRGYGYILLMSSVTAWLPYPGIMLYSATKRYIKDFGKALHYEMKDYGIKVCTVCPAAVNTNLYKLNNKWRKLAVKCGFMLNADKLANKAIKALYTNKCTYLPGFIAKLTRWIGVLIPMNIIQLVRHKTNILDKK